MRNTEGKVWYERLRKRRKGNQEREKSKKNMKGKESEETIQRGRRGRKEWKSEIPTYENEEKKIREAERREK